MSEAINVTMLVKENGERYVVLYRDSQRKEAFRVIQRWANDPDLSFTWANAATMEYKIFQEAVSTGAAKALDEMRKERFET